MRVRTVEIENYRSIRYLRCDFSAVTTFIGPNGAGKSNVLRALDWFFNGNANDLSSDDFHAGSEKDASIRVRVDFEDLTDEDRSALGRRYAPNEQTNTLTVWRTWTNGEEKITGRALAFPPFEAIRSHVRASDKKIEYARIRNEYGLPAWTNMQTAEEKMTQWELENPDRLEHAEVSDTHFFGISGQSRLAELFDFVFVSADLRAGEEAVERKNSLLDRILRRAIDRTSFDEALSVLADDFEASHREIASVHLDTQLAELAQSITTEVSGFTTGRSITLEQGAGVFKAPAATIAVAVDDRGARTPITHQGHGFQRTLLLAGLTVLSRRSLAASQAGSMFLAVEEPELFQHPTQARAFASVLRALASDADQRTQVAYATHSAHFIEPSCFDDVRRVTSVVRPESVPESVIATAAISDVSQRLDGYVNSENVTRRFEQVCLKSLPEALFADAVILVEGEDDAAIVQGLGHRIDELAVQGVAVAPVFGKGNMMIPFAILESLRIPCLMLVDNDSGCGNRMRANGRNEEDIQSTETAHRRDNRKLCRFVGELEEDYPTGAKGDYLAFVPDTLETLLDSDLPGWSLTRTRLVEEGRGVDGKHAGTYALAIRECDDEIGDELSQLTKAWLRVA